MPEVSDNAAILIATSFQALERAKMGNRITMICNCTVAIAFAGFFLEENLDVIIEKMKKAAEMKEFSNNKIHPGLFDKLAWFYNFYVTKSEAVDRNQLFGDRNLLLRKLEERFPGFKALYDFRNGIAHGKINDVLNLEITEILRKQAKEIVTELLKIAGRHVSLPRTHTYTEAVSNFSKNYPTI